jgi:hypothetical protein
MTELKKYTGSCHCGKVRYEVELDLTAPVIACNCSMCGRSGTLLAFVPAHQFKLLAGEDALTDYLFNHHAIHHTFCNTCGIKPFASGVAPDGTETRAINTRCLDGVDIAELQVQHFDGKSR